MILLFLILNFLGVVLGEACSPGEYFSLTSAKSELCHIDFFCSGDDIARPCDQSSYSLAKGSPICLPVPNGLFKSNGLLQACLPGHFCKKGELIKCAINYHQPLSGQNHCVSCPSHTYAKPGAAKCSKCTESVYFESIDLCYIDKIASMFKTRKYILGIGIFIILWFLTIAGFIGSCLALKRKVDSYDLLASNYADHAVFSAADF